MSNRAYLTRTKFVNDNGSETWGWRIGDNYITEFVDIFETAEEVSTSPLELLCHAAAVSEECVHDMVMGLVDSQQGMYINGDWREAAEIASALHAYFAMEE